MDSKNRKTNCGKRAKLTLKKVTGQNKSNFSFFLEKKKKQLKLINNFESQIC